MLPVSSTIKKNVTSTGCRSLDARTNIQEIVCKDISCDRVVDDSEKVDSLKNVTAEKFMCYECDKSFPSNQEVIMHLKLLHNACASRDCSKISDFKMHSPTCINRGFGCTICNKKFSEKYLLLMHFNEHIGAAFYVCDICRDGFQQRKDLQRHLLHVHEKNVCIPVIPSHSKAVYQKCNQCAKYYRLFAEFEEHSSSCCNSAVYACSICQIHFPSLSELDEHKLVEHKHDNAVKGNLAFKSGKRYFCGLCYIGFLKGTVLKQHLETHKMDVSFICDVCHSRFSCDEDLQMHYLLHIEEHYVLHDVISQHSCNSCKKTYKTQKDLKNHLPNCNNHENLPVFTSGQVKGSSYNDDLSVSMSDKENSSNVLQNGIESAASTFDSSQVLIYALKSGEDLLNCDDKQCVIVMDLNSVFVLQRGICASESRMPDVNNSQAYNENDAIDASLLQTHMFQILSPGNEDFSNLNEYADTPLDMENLQNIEQNCNTETGAIENIAVIFDESNDDCIQHNFLEGGDKGYFESLSATEDSTNSESTKEIFEVVSHESTLKSIELSSNDNKGCSSNVIIKENEVSFVNKHSTDEVILNEDSLNESTEGYGDMHVCNICKQVFSSKTSLCLHMKGRHTGYDCYRCGNSFKSEEELKHHEKISHPSAFHCDLCEVSYSKEHLLKKHKRSAHGGKHFMCDICGKSYVLKNEYEIHMMVHKGETPPSKCEVCGKIYASISNYIRHKAIHEGKSFPQKYKCTVCDKGFIARSPLKRHLSTHIKRTRISYECPKCKMYFPPKLLSKHLETHNVS